MKNRQKSRGNLVAENVGLGIRKETLEKQIKLRDSIIKKHKELATVIQTMNKKEEEMRQIQDQLNYLKVSCARLSAEIEALEMDLK